MARINRFDLIEENRRPRKVCSKCGKALPSSWIGDMCQECHDDSIYKEVRKYVEENDVGEYEVAEKFDIPVSTVRRWVKLGYMDYKKK